jgi:hypothetical protein
VLIRVVTLTSVVGLGTGREHVDTHDSDQAKRNQAVHDKSSAAMAVHFILPHRGNGWRKKKNMIGDLEIFLYVISALIALFGRSDSSPVRLPRRGTV